MPNYKHFGKDIYPVGNSGDCVADKPNRINNNNNIYIYDSYIVSGFSSSCLCHLPLFRHL